MSESIVFTSGKGGVGKTTAVAHIGKELASAGKRTAVLDMNVGLRNLDLVLGMEDAVVYDLQQVAERSCRIEQALVKSIFFPNLFLLPAACDRFCKTITAERLISICQELKETFDYILIDCPSGLGDSFSASLSAADRVVLLVTPDAAAIRDCDVVLDILDKAGITDRTILVNKIRPEMVASGDMLPVDDISNILNETILGIVPDDENVILAENKGMPLWLAGKMPASAAFRNIAKRIMGENVPVLTFERKIGILQRIFAKPQIRLCQSKNL